MYGSKRVAVRDLNPHILCALCGGYLIQATTVIECLHSFCRSCIVNFLETSKVCPICDAQIHKTRPLLNIRADQTLQSLVYKLVPGLFQDEMRRRREFHATLSESDLEDLNLEERGEASLEKEFKPGDDHVSLVLQLVYRKDKSKHFEIRDRRYLLCPSEVTVRHLKKFLKLKFQLGEDRKIDMYRAKEELTDELMLQDIALIYSWRREKPMHLCYTVTESPSAGKSRKETKVATSALTTCEKAAAPAIFPLSSAATVKSEHQTTDDFVSPIVKLTSPSRSPLVPPALAVCTPTNSNMALNTTSTNTVGQLPFSLSSPCNRSNKHPSLKVSETSEEVHTSQSSTNHSSKTGFTAPTSTAINCLERKHAPAPTIATPPTLTRELDTCNGTVKKQEASKLIHSVQSILRKSSHKTRTKHSANTTLSWTPVPDLHVVTLVEAASAADTTLSDVKESSVTLAGGSLSPNEITQKLRVDETENSPNVPSSSHPVTNIKKSQNVELSPGEPHRQEQSTEKVGKDHATIAVGNGEAEDTDDVFSSYIPKFQKHRKLCMVKRSVSCEETASTSGGVSTLTSDAMEKRNWKKRKLSTMDFDSSKITSNAETVSAASTIDKNTTINQTVPVNHITPVGCPGKEASERNETPVKQDKLTSDASPHQRSFNSMYPGSACYLPASCGPANRAVPASVTYLPFLLPPTLGATSPPSSTGKLSPCSTPDTKLTMDATVSVNNNKVTCKSRYSDTSATGDKQQLQALARFSEAVSPSHSNKKSGGRAASANKTASKSDSNGRSCATLTQCNQAGMGSKSVEEICVEISSSPSDLSSVTSPGTDVTSPGTEDRADSSALPEIQTSCDSGCVVSLPGKVVPLDLSRKKKK